MSAGGRVWRRAGIGIVVTVIFLGLLEGAARIQQYYRGGDQRIYRPRHFLDFYRFYRINPEYRSSTVRVNSAGFRNDEEIDRKKPPNVVRIVLMGGSTVWGENADGRTIDNRDTIAAHLEATLNGRAAERRSSVRVQVLNAGMVGYRLFQNVIYFDHYVGGFHPDIVIAMDGHNDLDALVMGIPPYHHRNETFFDSAVNRPGLLSVLWYLAKYVEERSLLVRRLSLRLSHAANSRAITNWYAGLGDQRVSDERLGEWLQEYVTAVRRLDASARIAGARALFTVQTETLGERYKRLTPEEVKIQETFAGYEWLHTVVRNRLVGRLKEVARKDGIWFEDISDVFKQESAQVYLDYTHLTSRGAQVLAGRLADVVEASVFGDKGRERSGLR